MKTPDLSIAPKEPPTMNLGDIAFFQKCSHSAAPNAGYFNFKGAGFGIFLGALPPNVKEPKEADILALMGAIGFVSFDDVSAFVGEEMMNKVIKGIEERHRVRVEQAKEVARIDAEKAGEKLAGSSFESRGLEIIRNNDEPTA